MKKIDIDTWERKTLYYTFGNQDTPVCGLNVRLDVTKLYNIRKSTDGFFIPFSYIVMRACNEFIGTRLRILDNEVYDMEVINPSFTVETVNHDFSFCEVPFDYDFSVYKSRAREYINKTIENAKNGIKVQTNDSLNLDVIYISCLKWVDCEILSNPVNMKDKSNISIPRINWCKITNLGDKYYMNFAFFFNHALFDGYECSCIINRIIEMLDNVEEYLMR